MLPGPGAAAPADESEEARRGGPCVRAGSGSTNTCTLLWGGGMDMVCVGGLGVNGAGCRVDIMTSSQPLLNSLH